VDPRLQAARPTVVAASEALRDARAVRDSGAWLEDKEYAVAVHTRRVADPESWASAIDQTARNIAEEYGLEVIPGKLVWELRPPVRSDKGDALRRVVTESNARVVVVVGDDLGDLPAFAAVAELTAEGHEGLRVAVRSDEAPRQLLLEADLIVDGPAGAWTSCAGWPPKGPGEDEQVPPFEKYAAALPWSHIWSRRRFWRKYPQLHEQEG
jgi:trehalose 6-phosphate phosphatase